MDIDSFLVTLLSSGNALLPNPAAMRVALPVVWAIVLGASTLLVAGRLARPYRLGLGFLVMLWTLLPVSASPAYWLGLAFQTPSLMSALVCLAWLAGAWPFDPSTSSAQTSLRVNRNEGPGCVFENTGTALKILACVGVVLGWVLLLDTLAWLPVSIYAWGFSAGVVAGVLVFAALLWVIFGAGGANRRGWGAVAAALPLVVLTLFVLTRLPTGNVWDALLDPWLWVALQVRWLTGLARRLLGARRSPPATRA